MQTLANWNGGGPGPWILFFPLIWAAVVIGVVTVLRRTARRGRPGPWRAMDGRHDAQGRLSGDAPLAVLGRRFASGEIDEDEYWRRLSVLDEQFGGAAGRAGKGGVV
ncbi:SHOCT domain-containing protein [Streptomyces sp. NBC_01451]|uniref:SHOCT domain-containing protein n=1 Tax=Streptomyces sp. NBC_01451 TaxID=2903872 RepID=UPI002E358437|nr:SHOCT domain-containing protein [Streptomyces sp. NBC_01451]